MEWIDIASLKLLATAIWLTIFSFIIPENVVAMLAVGASVTTIAFNIYRFYESRKPKNDDGASKENNKR